MRIWSISCIFKKIKLEERWDKNSLMKRILQKKYNAPFHIDDKTTKFIKNIRMKNAKINHNIFQIYDQFKILID